MENIDINIDNLRQMAQNQRSQSQGRRLTDYIYARDDLFRRIVHQAKEKMRAAAEAGHYRAILMSGKRQEDGLYPGDMFFGGNEAEGRRGIPFPSVWNPTGIPEEFTLLTKLRKAFQVEKNQNLRFYVKRDLRNSLCFHIFVDWSPRHRGRMALGQQKDIERNDLAEKRGQEPEREREGGYIQPRSKAVRNAVQIDEDGFILAVPRRGRNNR